MQIKLPKSDLVTRLTVETPVSTDSHTFWPGHELAEFDLPEGATEDHARITLCHLSNSGKPCDEPVEVHSPKGLEQEKAEAEAKAIADSAAQAAAKAQELADAVAKAEKDAAKARSKAIADAEALAKVTAAVAKAEAEAAVWADKKVVTAGIDVGANSTTITTTNHEAAPGERKFD